MIDNTAISPMVNAAAILAGRLPDMATRCRRAIDAALSGDTILAARWGALARFMGAGGGMGPARLAFAPVAPRLRLARGRLVDLLGMDLP